MRKVHMVVGAGLMVSLAGCFKSSSSGSSAVKDDNGSSGSQVSLPDCGSQGSGHNFTAIVNNNTDGTVVISGKTIAPGGNATYCKADFRYDPNGSQDDALQATSSGKPYGSIQEAYSYIEGTYTPGPNAADAAQSFQAQPGLSDADLKAASSAGTANGGGGFLVDSTATPVDPSVRSATTLPSPAPAPAAASSAATTASTPAVVPAPFQFSQGFAVMDVASPRNGYEIQWAASINKVRDKTGKFYVLTVTQEAGGGGTPGSKNQCTGDTAAKYIQASGLGQGGCDGGTQPYDK